MDDDLPSNGVITNGSSTNDEKDEKEEVNEQVDSSINSDLLKTLKSIFVDDFANKFNTDVVDKSFQQMKSSIGFKLNCQYSGEQMDSIFEVLKMMLSNHSTILMNQIVVSNTPLIESVLKKETHTIGRNNLNSTVTIKSEPNDDGPAEIVLYGDTNETIVNLSVTTENEPINSETNNDEKSQNQNMDIDVDDFMTDEDDASSSSDNDDDSKSSIVNVKVEEIKPLSTTNELIEKCDEASNLESISRIRIPDVLKDLEQDSSSNGGDNDHIEDNIDSESTSNLDSGDKKLKNSTTSNMEDKDDEKDLFSLDVSAIPNIDDDNEDEEHSVDDDFFQNPFNNFLGLDDLDQICGTAITGQVEDDENEDDEDKGDDDANEVKDNESEKNGENEANDSHDNNDPPESDKSDHDTDNDDNNEVVDNSSKIDKLLKDANKLVNSDEDDDNKIDDDDSKTNKSHSNSSDDSDDEKDQISLNLRKRAKKRLLSEDEDDKQSKKSSDDSDSSKSSTAKPIKRKRRKRVVIDKSSADEDDKKESDSGSDSDSPNKSRKKIKKILSPTRLNKETVNAEKAERERRKRIEEKQKLYNQLAQENETKSSQVDEVILDFNKETKQAIVEVDKAFVKHLKPHQVNGIKFLFDCTIETVDRLVKDDHAGGCILAHSMGLGKTFQVIAFLHTIMTNEHIKEKINKVLIIVPYNVIKNWANEFEKWFNECGIKSEILIHEIFNAKPSERASVMKQWHDKGGIMLITITLFSNLVNGKNKKNAKGYATFKRCLLDPGPDMVIVDEGHLLKNDQGTFNRSVSQVKTLRRVILTGTPLQNNLSEYFTMVDFVKPRLLGTKKEFKNRFENPIRNGQHTDSTAYDVHLMKKRVHILHKLLKDCIHRCDYNVLVPYLQPKFEYVLSLRLTQTQINMYKHYLENLVDRSKTTGGFPNLFHDYTILGLIWNHPALLHEHYVRKREDEDEEDSMDDFIDDNTSEQSDSSGSDTKKEKKKIKTRSRVVLGDNSDDDNVDSDVEFICEDKTTKKEEIDPKDLENQRLLRDGKVIEEKRFSTGGWYEQFLPEEIYQVELSVKFKLLFAILEKSEIIGDKILIFSQSLFNLNLIERFLKAKMDEYNDKYGIDKSYDELVETTGGISHRWIQGIDYFRIDGNVNCQNRTSIVDKFNDIENSRARLMLVSTKAGGIGINLVGANRCIIFDASWNPSNDMQAIFRIFRYGQIKPVYVYRFTAFGTMESKIYERQIIKQSLSHRVVDEQQIQRHFKASEISELYTFNAGTDETPKLPNLPKDNLLADIFIEHKDSIMSYHEHDSLLESRPEEGLTEEERKLAWTEYETEKERGLLPPPNPTLLNNMPLPMHFQGLEPSHMAQYLANRNFNPAFIQQLIAATQKTPTIGPNVLNHQRPFFPPTQGNNSSLASLVYRNGIPNSIYQPNSQPQNSNIEQERYNQDVQDFLKRVSSENIISFDGLKVNINVNTIINFEGKNLQFFEKEFFKILRESKREDVDMPTLTNFMFKYMEKCMQIAAGYQTQMKALHRQTLTANPIYFSLVRGGKSLENIHLEFIKKYKSNFNFPTTQQRQSKNNLNPKTEPRAGPSILKKSTPSNSREMRPRQLRSSAQKNIECITLSDDEM